MLRRPPAGQLIADSQRGMHSAQQFVPPRCPFRAPVISTVNFGDFNHLLTCDFCRLPLGGELLFTSCADNANEEEDYISVYETERNSFCFHNQQEK
ncbi:hypothetical protein OUZ56_027633 [Daphnia magna]|uniref:Uncharacterized protein n=1 Tax=Daphnia magna TaxID=35525 RepID=A0ABR0B1K1_9CRUS|nr:hypothetical protein OUZ56_027633 [Daphnia magna]